MTSPSCLFCFRTSLMMISSIPWTASPCSAPRIVILNRDRQIAGLFVVADTCTIKAASNHATPGFVLLIATYYVLNLEYPYMRHWGGDEFNSLAFRQNVAFCDLHLQMTLPCQRIMREGFGFLTDVIFCTDFPFSFFLVIIHDSSSWLELMPRALIQYKDAGLPVKDIIEKRRS